MQLEYRLDRLQPEKLRQAYKLLVPERRGEIPGHMGFRGKVSRSTLADANEAHDLAPLRRVRSSAHPHRAPDVRR